MVTDGTGPSANSQWLNSHRDHWLYLNWTVCHAKNLHFAATSCETTAAMLQTLYGTCEEDWEQVSSQSIARDRAQTTGIYQVRLGDEVDDYDHVVSVLVEEGEEDIVVDSWWRRYTIRAVPWRKFQMQKNGMFFMAPISK